MANKLTPGATQPGVQTRPSTEFDPVQAGTPTTGFDEAPTVPLAEFGPGAGIGNSRPGIH